MRENWKEVVISFDVEESEVNEREVWYVEKRIGLVSEL